MIRFLVVLKFQLIVVPGSNKSYFNQNIDKDEELLKSQNDTNMLFFKFDKQEDY